MSTGFLVRRPADPRLFEKLQKFLYFPDLPGCARVCDNRARTCIEAAKEEPVLAKDDIFDTLKDGVSLASRLAGRGVGEVSKALRPQKDPRGASGDTGLYYQRHLHPEFGKPLPQLEYQEFQQPRRVIGDMLKNLAIPAAERSFVGACQALVRGSTAETLERLSDAYSKDAQFTDAYFLYGGLSLGLEDYEEAVHTLKKVLLTQAKLASRIKKYMPTLRFTLCLTENSSFSIYPDLLGVNLLLSLAHRGRGDNEDAANVLDQLLGVMPDSPIVRFFLACHHVEGGRWSQVVELLKDTMPEDNMALANLILLGKACVAMRDGETAVELFRKILTRTDFDPQLMLDVRYNLGKALAITGRASEAESEFNRITSQYPGYMDLLERLGLEAESRKRKAIPSIRPPAALPAAPEAPKAAPVSEPPREDVHEAEFSVHDEDADTDARAAQADQPPAAAPEPPSQPRPSAPSQPKAESPSQRPAGPLPPPEAAIGMALVSPDGRVRIDLAGKAVTIGREEGDVVISWDSAASHLHARIEPAKDGWWVQDLGSTNGTFVNGHRISNRVLLNRGDVVTVGQTQLRLE